LQGRAAANLLKTLLVTGAVFGLAGLFAIRDVGHASENARAAKTGTGVAARLKDALSMLRRAPEVLDASFQATATLSSKEVCRIAEGFVKEPPTIESIDTIAHYLSKDVHGWSDLMIERFLKTEPVSAKAKDKSELKETFLQKWQNNRAKVQRWLEGCGVVVTALIARGRGQFERESSQIFTDVVSFIAAGVRKHDPDAFAAAEALARAETSLMVLLKKRPS
jgi:hypothetical protein